MTGEKRDKWSQRILQSIDLSFSLFCKADESRCIVHEPRGGNNMRITFRQGLKDNRTSSRKLSGRTVDMRKSIYALS